MTSRRLHSAILLLFLPIGTNAYGGSIRYELPNLLGEHRFDGTPPSFLGRVAFVDTPFGGTPYAYYTVTEARLVVEGHVTSGTAHGDGVIRENVEFDLLPSVAAQPSFSSHLTYPVQPTPESFRLETVYTRPFAPAIYHLAPVFPTPDLYPPISFSVRLTVRPTINTDFPPLIMPTEPGKFVLSTDGVIVDVPITAQITNAYIVLSGPTIVPEPNSFVAAIVSLTSVLIIMNRRTRRFS
jgi:hypothetical protein